MTLVGRTALSVEMNTKWLTSCCTDASTMFLVPITLLVTASITLSSMSGTCLCAAAWNTAKGRCVANTSCTRRLSRMSAITGTMRSAGWLRRSSLRISNIGFSPWPRITRAEGPSTASWRQSSLPMEPPAPVTSTVWSWASWATWRRSVWMGSRRSRSWISTLRSVLTLTSPVRISPSEGMVRVLMPRSSAAWTMRRITVPGAPGMAMITSPTRYWGAIWATSSSVPRMGRLPMRSPCLLGSSSTNPTGLSPSSGLACSSLRIIWPAAPAPAITTLRWGADLGPRLMECQPPMRMSRRGAARNTTLSTPPLNSTERGTREPTSP